MKGAWVGCSCCRSTLASCDFDGANPVKVLCENPGDLMARTESSVAADTEAESGSRNSGLPVSGNLKSSVSSLDPRSLYSHNNKASKRSRIAIPSPEKKEQDGSSKTDFDDERLFQLVRSEYFKMRSPLYRYVSLRVLHDIAPASSNDCLQSSSRWPNGFCSQVADEIEMMRLYRNPRLGKGSHEWVDRTLKLPRHDSDGDESVELVLLEGWFVTRIVLAVTSVVLLSILATLLWIFAGVGGYPSNTSGTWGIRGPVTGAGARSDGVAEPAGEWKHLAGAAGRVEATSWTQYSSCPLFMRTLFQDLAYSMYLVCS